MLLALLIAGCANEETLPTTATPDLSLTAVASPSPPFSQTSSPTAFTFPIQTPTLPQTSTPASAPSPIPTVTPTPTPSPLPTATPLASSPLAAVGIEVAFPNLPSFTRPVFLTTAGDGTNRLFLVLQQGRITVFSNERNTSSFEVFLDIEDRVNDAGNEEGLLGLAFAPDFAANGFFYVNYTAANPRRSVISRFSVSKDNPSRADPASEQAILEIGQPFPNHNGGATLFGPDGYLYIGLGDGGAGGDPFGNGQNRGVLLGKILRIDPGNPSGDLRYSIPPDNPFVSVPGARPEVWAYGLRNPWRLSFDRETDLLWVGDVGQNAWEEIDIVQPGKNYGWNIMEGRHCYPASVPSCDQAGLELPIAEYALTGGNCALIGGHVYRGPRSPALQGAYLYGDHCSGRIWSLRYDGQRVTEEVLLLDTSLQISSFGEDQARELYLTTFDGRIYRLTQG